MYTTTSLLTACLLAGGALPFTFPAQQPGQGTPKTAGEGDSIRLGLRLDEGVTHRFEVSENQPSTVRTGGLGESSRDVRPGQTGDVQDGNPGDGRGQQPSIGQRPSAQAQSGAAHLVSYEIKVRQAGEGGQDVTTLMVKKTKRAASVSSQPLGRDRDREPQDDRGQVGDVERGREAAAAHGSDEQNFIVEVTRKGEIRDIRLDGKDQDKSKDKAIDKGKPGQSADERGAHRLPGQDGGLVGMNDWDSDPTARVRDHLHAILGTGLHEGEIRTGEIVYIGNGTSGKPVEAGSGTGLRKPGQTGTDQRPSGVDDDMNPHATGQVTKHKYAQAVKLTGVALELQAVERSGQQRVARFRILEEPLGGLHGGQSDRQPGARSGDQPSELPRRETGQQPGSNEANMEGGIASYRVEDGLLEQLTFLARVEQPRAADKQPVGDQPVERREGEQGDIGRKDRAPGSVTVESMLNRQSITIRRVGN